MGKPISWWAATTLQLFLWFRVVQGNMSDFPEKNLVAQASSLCYFLVPSSCWGTNRGYLFFD